MPTYTYECPKCKKNIELILTISEYSKSHAPVCAESGCDGQQQMVVQLQPSPIRFKGSGWTPKYHRSNS